MANPALQLNVQATTIVQAYADDCSRTADALAPFRDVSSPLFSYDTWNLAEAFRLEPGSDRVGRRSIPTSRDYSLIQEVGRVEDFAMMTTIPQSDVTDAESKNSELDWINTFSESLARDLHRERLHRILELYANPDSYAPGNVYYVPASEKLSVRTGTVPDIVKIYLDQVDKMIVRPNKMVFLRRTAWTALRTHPRILEAVRGTGAGLDSSGAASREQVAELFEVDEVIVVHHYRNETTPREGEDVARTLMGTNDIAFVCLDPLSQLTGSVPTFCMTARYVPLRSYTVFDPMVAVEGATNVKVGWRIKEIIKAKHSGFLLKGVL